MGNPVANATPGDPNANSYATVVQAQAYFDSRGSALGVPEWDDANSQDALLIQATRVLDALAQPFKTLVPAMGGTMAYYRVRRQWTGAASTPTQFLAWPRTGMLDRNGNLIDPMLIPQELINATSELAWQLAKSDRTLDLDQVIQGITSLRAGSVSLGFKQVIIPQVIPDAVYNLLIQSWLTDEGYLPALPAELDVVSKGTRPYGSDRYDAGRGDDWYGD